MKHGEGKDQARELYVHFQYTFDEIAKRIGRSDKTVREWAIEENWKQQREEMLQSKIRVHEKLHSLVNKIADRMILDCDASEPISPQTLHALTNLVSAMNSSYAYEGKVKQQSEQSDVSQKTQDGLSDETLQKIEKQLSLL
jgi:predicted transcriptional regulator